MYSDAHQNGSTRASLRYRQRIAMHSVGGMKNQDSPSFRGRERRSGSRTYWLRRRGRARSRGGRCGMAGRPERARRAGAPRRVRCPRARRSARRRRRGRESARAGRGTDGESCSAPPQPSRTSSTTTRASDAGPRRLSAPRRIQLNRPIYCPTVESASTVPPRLAHRETRPQEHSPAVARGARVHLPYVARRCQN
jgi:hypothetical protein